MARTRSITIIGNCRNAGSPSSGTLPHPADLHEYSMLTLITRQYTVRRRDFRHYQPLACPAGRSANPKDRQPDHAGRLWRAWRNVLDHWVVQGCRETYRASRQGTCASFFNRAGVLNSLMYYMNLALWQAGMQQYCRNAQIGRCIMWVSACTNKSKTTATLSTLLRISSS